MMLEILDNISLKPYNTFGVESIAKKFVKLNSADQLEELINSEIFKNESKLILGGGSNLLLTKNFDGIVIKNEITGINKVEEDNSSVLITAGAGVVWDDLVDYAVQHNYGGIENLKLIPGTVGAAPIQNIGAYGVELVDVYESLKAYSIESGEERIFQKSDCDFGYRSSVFKKELKNKFIITEVTLRLSRAGFVNIEYKSLSDSLEKSGIKNPGIADVANHVKAVRESKLPDPAEFGNAGSFFKNPELPIEQVNELKNHFPEIAFYPIDEKHAKVAAGWLIDKAGLKGLKIGNSGTHSKQALVVVNYGGASGNEIYETAMFIKEKIKNMFGIELIPEVNII